MIFVTSWSEDEFESIVRLLETIGSAEQRKKPALVLAHVAHASPAIDDGEWSRRQKEEAVLVVCNASLAWNDGAGISCEGGAIFFRRRALATLSAPVTKALGDDRAHPGVKGPECDREVASEAAPCDSDTFWIDLRLIEQCGKCAPEIMQQDRTVEYSHL